jgi:uncharacterized protein
MAKSNAIGWFDIYVSEIERAVTFYESVLQKKLEPIGDPTGAGGALVKSSHGQPGMGGTMVYFNVEDCSIEAARVTSAGGRVIRPKFSIGEFGWVSICQDTEGNLFGLSSMK